MKTQDVTGGASPYVYINGVKRIPFQPVRYVCKKPNIRLNACVQPMLADKQKTIL
jgi:hypothetical protein